MSLKRDMVFFAQTKSVTLIYILEYTSIYDIKLCVFTGIYTMWLHG
jgi:hypothetical protein